MRETKDILEQAQGHPVVIFDGVCNLCNSSIDFIIRTDKQGQFLVTANQHEAGKAILESQGREATDVSTVFLYEDGKLYERSTAALKIARKLGFPWSLAYGFMIVPKGLRDIVYNWIARNRYRWFGEKETCRLPTPEERARFI